MIRIGSLKLRCASGPNRKWRTSKPFHLRLEKDIYGNENLWERQAWPNLPLWHFIYSSLQATKCLGSSGHPGVVGYPPASRAVPTHCLLSGTTCSWLLTSMILKSNRMEMTLKVRLKHIESGLPWNCWSVWCWQLLSFCFRAIKNGDNSVSVPYCQDSRLSMHTQK